MKARHVLVPLGVAGLAAALLLWEEREDPIVAVTADVAECGANLRRIHGALLMLYLPRKSLPAASGPALLEALLAAGALEDRSALACPGPGAEPPARATGTAVTSADTGYALRDLVAYPLATFPAGGRALEPMAACDNARGLNHAGCMNVLYSDGSLVTLTLAHEIASGRLPADATTIPVGPGSAHPDLVKLAP